METNIQAWITTQQSPWFQNPLLPLVAEPFCLQMQTSVSTPTLKLRQAHLLFTFSDCKSWKESDLFQIFFLNQ